jgi:hypothetical protein
MDNLCIDVKLYIHVIVTVIYAGMKGIMVAPAIIIKHYEKKQGTYL